MDSTLLLFNGTFTSISLLIYSIFQSKQGLTKEWGQTFSFILILSFSTALLISFISYLTELNLWFQISLIDFFSIAIIQYMTIGLFRIQLAELRIHKKRKKV